MRSRTSCSMYRLRRTRESNMFHRRDMFLERCAECKAVVVMFVSTRRRDTLRPPPTRVLLSSSTMGRNKKPRRNHQQQYAQLRAGLFDSTPLQPAQRDRKQRQIDHATRLFLLGLRLNLRLPTESASTRPARPQRDRWSEPEAAPLHPSQIGGDWSDRSISAPPTRTLSLGLTSKPAPDFKIEQGPVRSLASYAADVVASHLEDYDETLWTDGEGGMELQAARLVVRSLQEENDGELDPGNWARIVGGYGPDVLSPRECYFCIGRACGMLIRPSVVQPRHPHPGLPSPQPACTSTSLIENSFTA
jgi:hypothetical protein